jgi:hypothetical protein
VLDHPAPELPGANALNTFVSKGENVMSTVSATNSTSTVLTNNRVDLPTQVAGGASAPAVAPADNNGFAGYLAALEAASGIRNVPTSGGTKTPVDDKFSGYLAALDNVNSPRSGPNNESAPVKTVSAKEYQIGKLSKQLNDATAQRQKDQDALDALLKEQASTPAMQGGGGCFGGGGSANPARAAIDKKVNEASEKLKTSNAEVARVSENLTKAFDAVYPAVQVPVDSNITSSTIPRNMDEARSLAKAVSDAESAHTRAQQKLQEAKAKPIVNFGWFNFTAQRDAAIAQSETEVETAKVAMRKASANLKDYWA